MLIQVYRSERKQDTYLYVKKDLDLKELPEAMLQMLGELEVVMVVDLGKRQQLAVISASELQQQINEHGYWLQFPPADGHVLDSETCPV